jgi:NAD(P)-dependent dehydrogenase (short-subunit alcohol dehydrogenase family)
LQVKLYSALIIWATTVVSQNNKARQVAVVTGCSKGIGKAIATEFAKLGYCAVINSRNEDELKQAANDI